MPLETALAAALAGSGLFCRFDTASIDGRAPFDSVVTLTLSTPGNAGGLVAMTSDDLRPRLFRTEQNGIWTSFVNDEVYEYGRTAVIDIAPDGRATFVTNQQAEAAQMISREGRCNPAEDR